MVKPKGLLLFHGAGGDKEHPVFQRIEEALQIPVCAVNFSYRDQRLRRPDRLGVPPSHLLIGGRSMGGRVASMAVAGGLKSRGLVLLSYPLHPIGKPEKLRIGHFSAITRPCIFLSGDKDPFGNPELFSKYVPLIRGQVSMVWLKGQGHDPRKGLDTLEESLNHWIANLR